ncbi:unnamed protein product [Dovyalis caffra]|uniref:Uncharacterized protein n=1 Tax=Dovyalis caffra TaxID=77055 RepID=A0AAV1R6H8_9ROSI|nr:unnamed protein product [Dovyalis caffra]
MLGLAGSSSESEKKTETEQIVSVTYLIYEDLFPLFEVTPTSYESVTWNHAKRLESRSIPKPLLPLCQVSFKGESLKKVPYRVKPSMCGLSS